MTNSRAASLFISAECLYSRRNIRHFTASFDYATGQFISQRTSLAALLLPAMSFYIDNTRQIIFSKLISLAL